MFSRSSRSSSTGVLNARGVLYTVVGSGSIVSIMCLVHTTKNGAANLLYDSRPAGRFAAKFR